MKNIILLMFMILNVTSSFASDFDESNLINEININESTKLENEEVFEEFTQEDLKENVFKNDSINSRMYFDENNNPILSLEELLKYDIVYDEFQNPILVREIDENTLKELTFENEGLIQIVETTPSKEITEVEPINSTNNENNESEVLNNTFSSIDSNFTLYVMMASIGAGAFFFNGKNL